MPQRRAREANNTCNPQPCHHLQAFSVTCSRLRLFAPIEVEHPQFALLAPKRI